MTWEEEEQELSSFFFFFFFWYQSLFVACSFQIYRRQVKEKANRIRKDLSLRKKKGNIRPGESQRVLREMTRQKLGAEAVDVSRSSFLKI